LRNRTPKYIMCYLAVRGGYAANCYATALFDYCSVAERVGQEWQRVSKVFSKCAISDWHRNEKICLSNVYDRRGATDVRAEHRSSQVQVSRRYISHIVVTKSETRKAKEHDKLSK